MRVIGLRLRGIVYETLFGLLACTGMRISEALALTNADVDLKQGMLTIRLAKFGKSRQVPLHSSAVEALRIYRGRRDLAGISAQDEAPFFVGTLSKNKRRDSARTVVTPASLQLPKSTVTR